MPKFEDHPTVKRWREQFPPENRLTGKVVLDADWLRQLCLDTGADDVGFVEIDRPEIADQRRDVLAAFPPTKTLVSFVCRMNRENVRTPARSVVVSQKQFEDEQSFSASVFYWATPKT